MGKYVKMLESQTITHGDDLIQLPHLPSHSKANQGQLRWIMSHRHSSKEFTTQLKTQDVKTNKHAKWGVSPWIRSKSPWVRSPSRSHCCSVTLMISPFSSYSILFQDKYIIPIKMNDVWGDFLLDPSFQWNLYFDSLQDWQNYENRDFKKKIESNTTFGISL